MLRHQSIATIDNPEFINLQPLDISPLISSCDVKVLYLGENRNRTFINKTTATEMAKTLRGCPIVGYYKQDKEDFGDHGHRVIFDDDGIKFECLTVPFGFIAPDAPVWFQKFTETNPLGEEVEREYLMTKGLLWTGQFEEAKKVLENGGKGQSMELGDDMQGEWFTKENGVDLFIISDAIFSKLCILGDDVEPCFEGASITQSYSLMDKDFTATLYTMMSELKEVLSKGGQDNMVKEPETKFTEGEATTVDTQVNTETAATATEFTEEPMAEGTTESTEPADEGLDTTEGAGSAEFKKDDEEKDAEDKKDDTEEDDDEKDKKYQLLESEYAALQEKYDTMKAEFDALVAYKNEVEDSKKDKLIESFYFLSDEDKKDVIVNKSSYTYDEIEAKLSILAVRNKVDFNLGTEKEDKSVPATYTLGNVTSEDNEIPAWAKLASSL